MTDPARIRKLSIELSIPGRVPTQDEAMFIISRWLELFGTGGCYYPHATERSMLEDLKKHHEII